MAALKQRPRHFAQLLLPLGLLGLGCIALALDWRVVGLGLISASGVVLGALLWLRLRKLQARIDASARRMAALQAQMGVLSQRLAQPVTTSDVIGEALVAPTLQIDPLLPYLAAGMGLPPGLGEALQDRDGMEGQGLVIVPDELAGATSRWGTIAAPGRWEVVTSSAGPQRGRAAGLARVVVVDGGEDPSHSAVVDQSFFWWLPSNAELVAVSSDPEGFVHSLAEAHDVEFLLMGLGTGLARVAVARNRGGQ